MNRRQILKRAVGGSVALAAHNAKAAQMGVHGLGLNSMSSSPENKGATARSPKILKTFSEYLGAGAKKEIENEAQYISGFDPDIVEMRLPLQTKCRMQRKRNFKRLVEERRGWFDKLVKRDGHFEFYG